MGNGHNVIDSLIFMNDLQQFTQPVSTGVNIPTPQGDFFKNQPKLANGVGSPVNMLGGLSEEELLEIVMSVSPVGASIRGGKVAKSAMEQLWDIAKKSNVKVEHPSKWGWSKKMIDDFVNDNAISKAKILNQKILSGKGSTGKVGKFKEDPDKQGMVDSVTALLNYFSKN